MQALKECCPSELFLRKLLGMNFGQASDNREQNGKVIFCKNTHKIKIKSQVGITVTSQTYVRLVWPCRNVQTDKIRKGRKKENEGELISLIKRGKLKFLS